MDGIGKFSAHFSGFEESYIVIGGAACEDHIQAQGLTFRVTKDIDMILIVEGLSSEFFARFWEFIWAGKYERSEKDEGGRKYYRFKRPMEAGFPQMIELFSRVPESIEESTLIQFTPIPTEENLSSLSAILMDEEYYRFTIDHSEVGNGNFRRAGVLALICLKIKAFLNLTASKLSGEKVDSSKIKKHKLDVFRLTATLTEEDNIELPEGIRNDLFLFLDQMVEEGPNVKPVMKSMGVSGLTLENVINQLRMSFQL